MVTDTSHPTRRADMAAVARRALLRRPSSLRVAASAVALTGSRPAAAQDKPRSGGELVFIVPAQPPSFDAHREETFAMLHPGAPHHSLLMRVDPTDKTGTKFIGDLAESWSSSADKRTWTFKIRRGVKFHDGRELTSKGLEAT